MVALIWVVVAAVAAVLCRWLWRARRDEKRRRQVARVIVGDLGVDALDGSLGDGDAWAGGDAVSSDGDGGDGD